MAFAPKADWDALIQDWRDGASNAELLAKYKITKAALYKGLNKRGLVRSTDELVRLKASKRADDMAVADALGERLTSQRTDAIAEVVASVIRRQRVQLDRAQSLVAQMKHELGQLLDSGPQLEESIIQYFSAKIAMEPLAAGRLMNEMRQALGAISFGARTKALLNLASAEKIYFEMERRSYRIDDKDSGEKTYEDTLREMHAEIKREEQLALTHQTQEPVASHE